MLCKRSFQRARNGALLGSLLLALAFVAMPAIAREPIIDIHLHASAADDQGPPPLGICMPMDPMPLWDQTTPWADALIGYFKHPPCRHPIWSPLTDQEIKTKSLAILRRYNIIGVVNDSHARVLDWRADAPDRVLPATPPTAEEMADPKLMLANYSKLKKAGEVMLIGEVGGQYMGISPDSPALEGLWSVAEELDLPVSLHIGPGPPGTAYLPGLGYRARMSNPLLLEDVLVRHPKLRLNLMHAGFPMLDDTLALLYAHPQVYVDVGVIVYTQPRAAFYRYLKALVDGGFGNRILFGSDQMVWPEAIERSIRVIEQATFLTPAQKRDIFYNNAARFLRLDAATIQRHHAM